VAPGGGGTFGRLVRSRADLNDSGQLAFVADLISASQPVKQGVFVGDGTATIPVALEGQPVTGLSETLGGSFTEVRINNLGDVVFAGRAGSAGVFLNKGGQISPVALLGQSSPDLNGDFAEIARPRLTDSGYVAYHARLNNTIGSSNDDTGIFLHDGVSTVVVAREGESAPDGNGTYFSENCCNFALNERGQIAFEANLRGTAGGQTDDRGIFLFDPVWGIQQAVREGDPFLGSTIRELLFLGEGDWDSGFASSGAPRIAFWFVLEDQRVGIAKWSLPLAGDFNEDGYVNAADYSTWRNNLRTKYTKNDYLIWKENYGATIFLGEGAGIEAPPAVPEPAGVVLLAVGMVIGVRCRMLGVRRAGFRC
jgi:hypothetical protein